MGGHQKSVKTKSFLGQLCDEKNSVPYPSGNFRGCGAEFFCDRETGDSAGFCCGKKMWILLLCSKKCPEPESNQRHEDFQSSALPTELSGLHERAGARTPDNLIKSQVLYHLSYTPILVLSLDKKNCGGRIWTYDLRVMSPTSFQTAPPRANMIL